MIQGRDRVTLKRREEPRERIDWEEFCRRVPPHDGPPVTLEDMDKAIDDELRARSERKDWL